MGIENESPVIANDGAGKAQLLIESL